MDPHVGVTGFTRREQVFEVLEAAPPPDGLKLMVGVLASWKSLRGIPVSERWQPQFPDPGKIANLFVHDPRVLNLIHYWFKEEAPVYDMKSDLVVLRHEYGGMSCHGFQLNIDWPEKWLINTYRGLWPDDTIVLQVGSVAFGRCGGLVDLQSRLEGYGEKVDRFLIDPSGGQGRPFHLEDMLKELQVAQRAVLGDNTRLGLAGGLGPETMERARPVIEQFPGISIDAQGQLRNERNELDIPRVVSYLQQAYRMLTP